MLRKYIIIACLMGISLQACEETDRAWQRYKDQRVFREIRNDVADVIMQIDAEGRTLMECCLKQLDDDACSASIEYMRKFYKEFKKNKEKDIYYQFEKMKQLVGEIENDSTLRKSEEVQLAKLLRSESDDISERVGEMCRYWKSFEKLLDKRMLELCSEFEPGILSDLDDQAKERINDQAMKLFKYIRGDIRTFDYEQCLQTIENILQQLN